MHSNPDAASDARSSRLRSLTLWSGTLLGILALGLGLQQFDLAAQLPGHAALQTVFMLLLVMLPGLLLSRLMRRTLVVGLLAAFGLLTVAVVGFAPALAAILLLASAAALSLRLFKPADGLPTVAGLLAGLVLIGTLVGWTLPLPVHFRWLYLALALALIVPERRRLLQLLRDGVHDLDAAARARPLPGVAATLVVIATALAAWMPSLMYDDLGYHLGLPAQLQALGHYRMDAGSQIWAFAPWLGDSLFGVGQVLAGGDARGPVNLIWLGTAAALLYQLTCRLWPQDRGVGWLAVALFFSLPLNTVLVAGMQTELIGIALMLAALLTLLAPEARAEGRRKAFVLLLAGLAATKTSMLPFVAVLAVAFVVRHRHSHSRASLAALVPLALLLGGSSYAYAWSMTGNPILPIANGFFASPYFAIENFANPRYQAPLDASNLWALLFESSRFYESRDGVSGLHWLPLLAAALLACLVRRSLAVLAFAGLMLAVLQFSLQSYLRYLLPAMCLLVPAFAAGASLLGRNLGTLLVLLLAGLNLAFQVNAHWILSNERALSSPLDSVVGRKPLRDRVAPELRLIDLALLQDPEARVLLTNPERPFNAVAAGRAFTTSWYDNSLRLARGNGRPKHWGELLENYAFTHAIVHPRNEQDLAATMALQTLGADIVASNGPAVLWRLPPSHGGIDLYALRDRSLAAQFAGLRESYRRWHRGRKLRNPERYAPVVLPGEPAPSN